jgi:beta-aspartyl-dipeptidase (metallo-type)
MLRLLKNARVYSPHHLGVRDVLIGGEKILAIEVKIDLPKGLSCEACDLHGDRLIPGFIDAHVHALGGGGESGPASRVPAVPVSHFTRHGVTTVVSVLGTDDLTRSISSQITQVRSLIAEGLTAYCLTGGYHIPLTTLTGSARGDIVHVEQIIGIGELAISDHRSSQPTLEEFLRLASDAHVAGLMTGKAGILHLHMGDGERGLELVKQALETAEIPARVYNPAHCNRRKALFDEACKLSKKGCFIGVDALPVEEGEDALWAHEAILKYHDKGLDRGMITVSSDSGGCLPKFNDKGEIVRMDIGTGEFLPHTLDQLLKSGLELEDALPTFTTNAASLLRLPHKGRISTGCDADLVQLDDGNGIKSVMARGAWHVRDGEILRRGMFEK